MQPLQDMQIRDDPKKGLHDVRSFVGACNFYRRHIHNFTYSSAPLTDLIKKTTPWRWTAREEECFQELKKKIASSMKVLPWVVDGAGGLGAGKTSGAGTRGVSLNAAIGGRTGYSDTNGGESSNN